jgi:diguanylate cyclase (GGDEF)-like protein
VDDLTKLPRRDAFERALGQAVSAASAERPVTLLLIDLDKFKAVNDTWGHAFGDEVLVAAAKAIGRLSTSVDATAYRWGGEEFAILLTNRTAEEARAWADRLRAGVRKIRLATPKGTEYSPTVSVGSATLMGALGESHAVVSRGLFDLADQALYEAKETGRDRMVARQFTIGGALQQEPSTGE